jgi:hypothetical protein
MQPSRRSVTLPNGEELEWMQTPLTIAERQRAQKSAKSDDAIEFALMLLISKAKDQNGEPLFVAGELAELRNVLPAKVVDEIMLLVMDAKQDEEEEAELDPKPSPERSRKTAS